MLEALIAQASDEMAKVSPEAKVSNQRFVFGLIIQEAEKKGIRKK